MSLVSESTMLSRARSCSSLMSHTILSKSSRALAEAAALPPSASRMGAVSCALEVFRKFGLADTDDDEAAPDPGDTDDEDDRENVHQVALHTVRGGSSNVDAVASTRIEFRCLARCEALEDGSLAAEGQEVLEGERAVGVQD
jgi:hypothetical protein